MTTDTIYAPSTAIGGAIALIRVSGPSCADIAKKMLDRDVTKTPRMLRFARMVDGERVLDDGMACFLPGKGTYTGEDMLELSCHGGSRTVARILERLSKTGARPAEPGEFTKRAFLNGKMDLSEAEAVMDVVSARAEESLRAALDQLPRQPHPGPTGDRSPHCGGPPWPGPEGGGLCGSGGPAQRR